MSTLPPPTDTASDRIKLPFTFDAPKMLEEIKQLELEQFVFYNVITLRGPAHLIDTSLPEPPPALDYADGSWTDWLDIAHLEDAPYLKSVIDFFKEKTKVTLVRLMRLEAGATVQEHTDPTLGLHIERSVIRLTVPIKSGSDVEFYLNDKVVPMKEGECWYLRLTDPHRVVNGGEEERINLSIDMIPNEWVSETILQSEAS